MNEPDGTIATPRLRLIPALPPLIAAELEGPDRLAALLDARIPADWPPEHHDRETLEFWRDRLLEPSAAGWWLYYARLAEPEHQTLVGSVGYKGPPHDGVVEIGYSVVPSWQRLGLATEASRALIEAARRRGASVIVAHTLEQLVPSIRVLRKLGFEPTESSEPGALEFRLDAASPAT